MKLHQAPARVNVKLVLILALVVLALGAGVYAAREIRRGMIKRAALAAGRAAFDRGDWETACAEFKRYYEKDQKNVEVLEKFARAKLNVRPTTLETINAAIWANRRLLQLEPDSIPVFDALAELYIATRNANELAYIGRRLSERFPDDPRGPLWTATSLLSQQKIEEARRELESLEGKLRNASRFPPEYLDTCAMLSAIELRSESPNREDLARNWLTAAVEHAPESAYALLNRARYFRQTAESNPTRRDEFSRLAQADLEAAESRVAGDARDALSLSQEWLAWGALERAAAEMDLLVKMTPEEVQRRFADVDDWTAAVFLLRADLALRRGDVATCGALADEALGKLKYANQRLRILPTAVKLYIAAGRIEQAQKTLEDYRKEIAEGGESDALEESIALLAAGIAQAENKPQEVVAALQSYLTRDPRDPAVFRVLAEAYQTIGQPRLAEKALSSYMARTDASREPQFVVLQARMALRAGRYADAVRSVQMLTAPGPEATLIRVEAELARVRQETPDAFKRAAEAALADVAKIVTENPRNGDAAVLLASLNDELGRDAEAERILKESVEHAENPLPPELALVQLYLSKNDTSAALAAAQQVRERNPESAEAWIAGAFVLAGAGKEADARALFEEGLQKVTAPAPRRALALEAARFDLAHGARQAGIERLETLADVDPSDVITRALLLDQPEYVADAARVQRRIDEMRKIEGADGCTWRICQAAVQLAGDQWQQQADEIRKLLEPCLEIDPGFPPAASLLGELDERLGQMEQAESLYQRALADNPAAVDVADRLMRLLQKQNRYAEARRLLERYPAGSLAGEAGAALPSTPRNAEDLLQELQGRVARDPQDVDALIRLAWLTYRSTGNVDEALHSLEAVAALPDRAVDVASIQAAVLEDAGRTEELRGLLDRLVEARPEFESYLLRATFLYRLRDLDGAERDCRHLTTFADRPDGFLQLGMFYADTDRLNRALDAWQTGLEKFPDNAPLKTRLMTGLLDRGSPEDRARGARLLNELQTRDPDNPHLLAVQALLKLREGAPEAIEQAEQLLQRVVELRPAAVDAHMQLIRLAMRAGNMRVARERITNALRTNPEAIPLILVRAEIEAQDGNFASAVSLTRSVLDREPGNADALHLFAQLAARSAAADLLEEAVRRLTPIAENPTAEPRLFVDLAFAHAAGNQAPEALKVLDRLPARSSPRDRATAMTLRVELLNRAGDCAGIQELLPQLTAGDASFPEAFLHAAATLLSAPGEQYHSTARAALEAALAKSDTTEVYRMDIAGVLYQAGVIDRAAEIYEGVLAADAAQPRACNDLAWILAHDRHEYPQALDLASRGLQTATGELRLNLLDTRGVILLDMQRYEDARRDFEELTKTASVDTPAFARACLQLARVCAKLGDRPGFQNAVQEAVQADRRLKVFTDQERAELDELRKQAGL